MEEALGPYDNGRQYLNFTEEHTDPARFYTPHAYRRLRQVKRRVRPGQPDPGEPPDPPGVARADEPTEGQAPQGPVPACRG